MTPTKEKTPSQIPSFETIEKEAEYWDTHDITDYIDEIEEISDLEIAKIRSEKGVIMVPRQRIPLSERIKAWLANRRRGSEAHSH